MKKSLKWVSRIVIGLVVLIIVALAVPFLVDFSHFKPQIQQAASQAVNADIDFESARLHIFPAIGVKLTKVSVINNDPEFKGTKLFSVDEVFFKTDFMPLLTKQEFKGTIKIAKPEITIATMGTKNNIGALPKQSAEKGEAPPPATSPDKKPEEAPAPKGDGSDDPMKMIKEKVSLESFVIEDAAFILKDLKAKEAKEPVKITDLDIKIENIGLERDIKAEISTKAEVAQGNIKVQGPIVFTLNAFAKVTGKGFDVANFSGKLDMDSLDINAMNAFLKPKGTALNLAFKGEATANSLNIDDFTFNLQKFAIGLKLKVEDFKQLITDFSAEIKNDDLKALGDLLPQHKQLLQEGAIHLVSSVNGPLSDPTKGVKAKVGLNTKLTGSDVSVNVDVMSIEPPRVNLLVQSHRLDLGAILKPFLPPPPTPEQEKALAEKAAAEKAAAEKAAAEQTTANQPPAPPAKDFELTPEQKNMLKGADINAKITMNEFLFDKIKITKFVLDTHQKDLKSELAQLSLDGFGGNLMTKGLVDLGATPIAFKNDFALNQVKAEEFLALIKPEHANLLKGKLTLLLKADGAGTTVPTLSKTLNGKGTFQLQDGELHSQSVGEAMQKEFDGMVGGLSITAVGGDALASVEKLMANPALAKLAGGSAAKFDPAQFKKKYESFNKVNIGNKLSTDQAYKDVKGDIEIKDGRIWIKSKKEIKGGIFDFNGSVGIDSSLSGKTVFIASEGFKKDMLSQSQYASLMFDEKNNFSLDIVLSGDVANPKIGVATAAIKERFTKNAKALVEKEVKQTTDGQLKNQKDKIAEELRKKQQEAEAKLKAEADAKRKAEEDKAKNKAQEELKKKLPIKKLF